LSANAPKPEEQTSSVYRFRVRLAPKAASTLDVRESEPASTSYSLSDVTSDQIALFARQKSINPEIEAALRKIIAQKDPLAAPNRRYDAFPRKLCEPALNRRYHSQR